MLINWTNSVQLIPYWKEMEKRVLRCWEMPHPTICLQCGSWLDRNTTCPTCGFIPSSIHYDLYSEFLELEKNLRPVWQTEEWSIACTGKVNHGWGPDVLAILSAIALGVISNVTFDVIKTWLLMRKRDYYIQYRVVKDYDKVISILIEFYKKNPQHFDKLLVKGHSITFEFKPIDSENTN